MNFEKIINFIDDKYHHKRIVKFLEKYKIYKLIDVGSHKGEFLKNFLKFKNIKIAYAFEPQVEIFKILNKNLNKYKNIIKHNIALDSKIGKKKIYINKLSSTSTLSTINKKSLYLKIKKLLLQNNGSSSRGYIVKTSTFDEFFKKNDLKDVLLKIDVEGFEYNVLLGSKKLIHKIKFIIIEKQFYNLHKGYNFNLSHKFLLKNNFVLHKKFKFPLMNFEDRLYINTLYKIK